MTDASYPDALPSQHRLHWYVLERVLGQGGFGGAINVPPLTPMSMHEDLFFGPWGSLNPSGDLVLETRAWRDKLFTSRETPTVGPSAIMSSSLFSQRAPISRAFAIRASSFGRRFAPAFASPRAAQSWGRA